jgi:hypothetical protein
MVRLILIAQQEDPSNQVQTIKAPVHLVRAVPNRGPGEVVSMKSIFTTGV